MTTSQKYSTDQFKLVMDSRAGENKGFGSTGNKAIDVVLQKYINLGTHVDRPGCCKWPSNYPFLYIMSCDVYYATYLGEL